MILEIDKEDLIDIIKECIVEVIWETEKCLYIFSDEDIQMIEDKIDGEIKS